MHTKSVLEKLTCKTFFSFHSVPIQALAFIQEKPLQWNIFWHCVEIAVLDVCVFIYVRVPNESHK